jgi:hypothetical protein
MPLPGPLQNVLGAILSAMDLGGHDVTAAVAQRSKLREEVPGIIVSLEFIVEPTLFGR